MAINKRYVDASLYHVSRIPAVIPVAIIPVGVYGTV